MALPSFNPLAVIAGCAIDMGFSFAAGAALSMYFALVLHAERATAAASTEFLLPLVSLGALGTVLGGGVAARFAGKSPLAHGLAVGGVSTALGLISLLGDGGGLPQPWSWIQVAAALPAGLLGATLGSPRR